MKDFLFITGMALVLTGCAVVAEESVSVDTALKTRRFISLHSLVKGMSRAQTRQVLTDKIIVGYTLVDAHSGQYQPITVQNPYRSETVARGAEEYVVEYFLVGINQPDDQVTDDELAPLVFKNDQLIGWGWPFFNQQFKTP